MINRYLQILQFFKSLKVSEDKLYFQIIDILSSEYGWTVEYIQKLTMTEIARLFKVIRDRKDSQDQISQMNIAKGMTGKISSNRVKKNSKKKGSDEERKLQQLANILKGKVKRKVKE